jgi:MATE family multidrug resistance protein
MTDIADLNIAEIDARPVTAEGLTGWLEEARALAHLAVPLIVTQLAQMAIMTTDIIMLGRLSSAALAAATLGNTVFFLTWLLGFGPASAVSPMVAHALGANPNARADVRHIVRMGLWSVLIVSLPLMSILLFTRPILLLLGQEPGLAANAAIFTTAIALGLPASLGFQVLRNFATALHKPAAPLVVMALAIGFNALGDYALIFGHFGLPKLGIVGSGTASALSYIFTFLAMLAVIGVTPGLRKYRILRRFWRARWYELSEVFRLGMPIGVTTIFEAMMFNAATLVMGTFGTATLAAHQIAMNVPSITFMVPLGLGMAATVRVGTAAGAGNWHSARRSGYCAMVLGALFMAMTATILWCFAPEIAHLYLADTPANAAVIRRAALFLHVAAIFQLADGQQVTMSLSLRGLKDARAPMWIAGASYWLAGAPMCAWLAFGVGMKGLGIWYGLAFGLLVAAALMTARFAALSARP